MPDQDLTKLSDTKLRAATREALKALAIAKREAAKTRQIHTKARAIVSDKESRLKLLRLEDQRRFDERVAESRAWREEQSNFEKQLGEIMGVILKHFPEELTQTASIPEAVRRIVERFSSTNVTPRALHSTEQPPTNQPKH